MSKHGRNRHKHGKGQGVNLLSSKGKGKGHQAQVKSPGAEAQAKAKAGKQEGKDKDAEDMRKDGLTVITDPKTGRVKATDGKGKPALTKEDEAKLTKAQKSQAKARQARLQLLELQREAKRDMEELTLNGSGAIKAMVTGMEAKIKAAQAKVTAIDAEMDALKVKRQEALEPLNALLAEYKGLTGLDKASKGNSKGKGKGKANANGNGRFNAVVKGQGDHIKVLVTHLESKSLFETSLTANGKVKESDWIALRHRFVAFFERPEHKRKVDKGLDYKAYDLVLRAYLSNLKGKIEQVKPIV